MPAPPLNVNPHSESRHGEVNVSNPKTQLDQCLKSPQTRSFNHVAAIELSTHPIAARVHALA